MCTSSCLSCGKCVTIDDETRSIVHDPPECDYFKGVVERNKTNAYAGIPMPEAQPGDALLAARLMNVTPEATLFEIAAGFGFKPKDTRDAAQLILREMRRRGYRIEMP